jgi:hypothetical protein
MLTDVRFLSLCKIELEVSLPGIEGIGRPYLWTQRKALVPRPGLEVSSVRQIDIHVGIKLDQGPVWIEVVGGVVMPGCVS